MTASTACEAYDPKLIDEGRAFVPPRPADSTSSPSDTEEVAFAIRNIYLRNPGDLLSRVGLDLDDRNTQSVQNAECKAPTIMPGDNTDGVNGIDNALGSNLLESVREVLPCLEDDFALAQGIGLGTIILDVSGWNGEMNDASVDIGIANAVDGSPEDPTTLAFDPTTKVDLTLGIGGLAEGPAWAGEDFWWLNPADFNSNDRQQPRNKSNGYIASGRLVVPLSPGSSMTFSAGDGVNTPNVGSLEVTLSDGWLFGDISDDGKALVRGAISGRFSLIRLTDAISDIGICGSLATVVDDAVQQFADVVSAPGTGGPNAICDAMSVGVAFDAVAGTFAGLGIASRPTSNACPTPSSPPPANGCCASTVLAGTAPMGCDASIYNAQPNALPVPQPDF